MSTAGAFVLGALAKSVATLSTYPLIRSKVMIQAATTGTPESSYSMLGMLQHVRERFYCIFISFLWFTFIPAPRMSGA